jgi:hypothetical protein
MQNGLKPVIIVGVVLLTSSVKAVRRQVWGPSINIASSVQTGLYRETLFWWTTPRIFRKISKHRVKILHIFESCLRNMSKL